MQQTGRIQIQGVASGAAGQAVQAPAKQGAKASQVASRTGEPVSYTHLDVYKRQVRASLTLSASPKCIWPRCSSISFRRPRRTIAWSSIRSIFVIFSFPFINLDNCGKQQESYQDSVSAAFAVDVNSLPVCKLSHPLINKSSFLFIVRNGSGHACPRLAVSDCQSPAETLGALLHSQETK